MIAWEYHTEAVRANGFSARSNDLGKEGWELVSVVDESRMREKVILYRCFFKRLTDDSLKTLAFIRSFRAHPTACVSPNQPDFERFVIDLKGCLQKLEAESGQREAGR